jgi:hypothetical protein
MRSRVLFGLAACAAAAATLVAQGNPMRPGQWETTMQMSMPNMPMQMPPMKSSQCVTAADLQKDPATGLPRGTQNNGSACKVSDYTQTGNTIAWKVTCTAPAAVSGDGEVTFMGDGFTGVMRMSLPQGEMSAKLTGTRVGDCQQ